MKFAWKVVTKISVCHKGSKIFFVLDKIGFGIDKCFKNLQRIVVEFLYGVLS